MKSLFSTLKKLKPVHWLYNLLHYKKLTHNKAAYKKYNLHKPLFASISSKDFPDKKSRAWLDVGDSKELVPNHPDFKSFPVQVQEQLLTWSDNGFMLLQGFFDNAMVSSVNHEIDKIVQKDLIKPTHDNKLPFANKVSPIIKKFNILIN